MDRDNIDKADTNIIFLKHTSGNKMYMVDKSAICKSKVLHTMYTKICEENQHKFIHTINSGTEDALIFVVKYLNFYKDKSEIPSPEHPLPENISLIDLFEYEQNIFGDLLNDISDKLETNMSFVSELIKISHELQLDLLLNKLSAIMCFYMYLDSSEN